MVDTHTVSVQFSKTKETALDGVDFSRKGSIDEPIVEFVQKLNSFPQYFTTSTCSGRTLIAGHTADSKSKKKGCKWLYVTHGHAVTDDVLDVLKETLEGDYSLKFEPFIMHVQCANLEAARELLQTAVGAGYRNSGISLGIKGKLITAVRCTANMEVPIVSNGKLLVGDEYIKYLVGLANTKMEENHDRIRLLQSLLVFKTMEIETKIAKRPDHGQPAAHDKISENHINKPLNQNTNKHSPNYNLDEEMEQVFEDMFRT